MACYGEDAAGWIAGADRFRTTLSRAILGAPNLPRTPAAGPGDGEPDHMFG